MNEEDISFRASINKTLRETRESRKKSIERRNALFNSSYRGDSTNFLISQNRSSSSNLKKYLPPQYSRTAKILDAASKYCMICSKSLYIDRNHRCETSSTASEQQAQIYAKLLQPIADELDLDLNLPRQSQPIYSSSSISSSQDQRIGVKIKPKEKVEEEPNEIIIREKLNKSIKQELRQELNKSIKQELRQELSKSIKQELRQELSKSIKQELRQELSKSIKQELRQELSKSIKQELRQELKPEIYHDLRKDIYESLKRELQDQIYEELSNELVQDLEKSSKQLKQKLITELTSNIHHEIRLASKDSQESLYTQLLDSLGTSVSSQIETKLSRFESKIRSNHDLSERVESSQIELQQELQAQSQRLDFEIEARETSDLQLRQSNDSTNKKLSDLSTKLDHNYAETISKLTKVVLLASSSNQDKKEHADKSQVVSPGKGIGGLTRQTQRSKQVSFIALTLEMEVNTERLLSSLARKTGGMTMNDGEGYRSALWSIFAEVKSIRSALTESLNSVYDHIEELQSSNGRLEHSIGELRGSHSATQAVLEYNVETMNAKLLSILSELSETKALIK